MPKTYEIPTNNGYQTVQATDKQSAISQVPGATLNPTSQQSVQSYIKNGSNTMDASRIGTASTATVPSPYTSNTAQTKLATTVDGVLGSLPSVTAPETPAETESQKARTSLLDRITSAIGGLSGKGSRTSELNEQEGVFDKKKLATEIENEAIAKSRSYDKQIEKIRQNAGGLFGGAVEQEIANVERLKNSELADIAIRYKVAAGDYNQAVEIVQSKVDAEFEPLQDEITNLTNLYNLYADDMTESEKMQANAAIQEKQSAIDYQRQIARDKLLHQYNLSEKAGSGGGVTDGTAPLYTGLNPATATAVRGVVSGFKSEPQVTNFTAIQDGYDFVTSLSDTTTNPSDDQALIYALAKVLDPGSVVREGEYATAQKYAQSWAQAYGKKVTQAIAGTGFLSEEARRNIKNTIKSKYESSKNTYNNISNQYVNQINNLTGRQDGQLFLRDYSSPTQQTINQSTSVQPQTIIYQGKVYNVDSEGNLTPKNNTETKTNPILKKKSNLF